MVALNNTICDTHLHVIGREVSRQQECTAQIGEIEGSGTAKEGVNYQLEHYRKRLNLSEGALLGAGRPGFVQNSKEGASHQLEHHRKDLNLSEGALPGAERPRILHPARCFV